AGPGDDVAGLGLGLGDPAPAVGDLAGGARDVDAGGLVGVVHQTGAVHAAERGAAAAVRGADGGAGGVHDRAARARGGGGDRGAAGRDAGTVEGPAGLRADDTVDEQAVGGLVALHRGVGAGTEDAVDGQVRAVVVERGLEVLDRAAAGAPAELLRGVEDGRGRGDRRSGGEGLRGGGARGRRGREGGGRGDRRSGGGGLRGGGARGRRGRGGGSGRRGLGRTTGECGAEDDAAEDGCAAEAARCALCVLGGELGAAGEAVGVVLGHD